MEKKEWEVKYFNQLTTTELYDILKLRIDVFVVEQNCYYPDIDNLDNHAETLHLFTYTNNQLTAYLRILAPNTCYIEYAGLGRVVVAKEARGNALGHRIISKAISLCHQFYPTREIKLSAQQHLEKFYQQHGFERVTDTYLEDNIPHIGMVNSMKNIATVHTL